MNSHVSCHYENCRKQVPIGKVYVVRNKYFCRITHARKVAPNLQMDTHILGAQSTPNDEQNVAIVGEFSHKKCENEKCDIFYPINKGFEVYEKKFCSMECLIPYRTAQDLKREKKTSDHVFVKPSFAHGGNAY